MTQSQKYIGQKDEASFSNAGGIDLSSAITLPTVNTVVTVEIPKDTWFYFGIALVVPVLIFGLISYFLQGNETEK